MVEHDTNELSAHYDADIEARGTRGLNIAMMADRADIIKREKLALVKMHITIALRERLSPSVRSALEAAKAKIEEIL